jgi:pre-mRNA-splicing factor 38A
MYLRLTVKGAEVYELLEPFYNDNRKLVMKDFIGRHEIIYVDEFVDKLLTEEVVMGIVLPFLPKRMVYEEQGIIEERVSILEQGMEGEMEEGEDENEEGEGEEKQEENMNLMIEEEDEEE